MIVAKNPPHESFAYVYAIEQYSEYCIRLRRGPNRTANLKVAGECSGSAQCRIQSGAEKWSATMETWVNWRRLTNESRFLS